MQLVRVAHCLSGESRAEIRAGSWVRKLRKAPLCKSLSIVYGFCILLSSVEDRLGGTVAIVCSVCLFRHYCKYELNNVSSMFVRSIEFGITEYWFYDLNKACSRLQLHVLWSAAHRYIWMILNIVHGC